MTTPRWIVVADQRTARVLSLDKTPGGRWRARERASLENQWKDYHDHGRPTELDRPPAATSHEHFAPSFSDGEESEERRRFARDVAQWLERECNVLDDQRVTLFAAPGLFASLREEIGRRHGHAEMFELELAHLRPDELAEHPAVRRALHIASRPRSFS